MMIACAADCMCFSLQVSAKGYARVSQALFRQNNAFLYGAGAVSYNSSHSDMLVATGMHVEVAASTDLDQNVFYDNYVPSGYF